MKHHTFKKRLKALEAKVAQDGIILTEGQLTKEMADGTQYLVKASQNGMKTVRALS